MEYRRLGGSGLLVSPVCLGMMSFGSTKYSSWVLPATEGERFVGLALDRGINFFDTAPLYSYGESEEILGSAIKNLKQRHRTVIATKVGIGTEPGPNQSGLSRGYIMQSVDQSLKRLQTDYIDMLMLHREYTEDPIEETIDALNDVLRSGKVRYMGLSNFPAWSFARAHYLAKHKYNFRFAAAQLQYNLAYREDERETIPFCAAENIGITVYSPLARGLLAGNQLNTSNLTEREKLRAQTDVKAHATYNTPADAEVVERLQEIARDRGVPAARVAMAWILSKPTVHSITCGATEEAHLDEAIEATKLALSDDEIAQLEEPYVVRPVMPIDVPIIAGGGKVR